MLGQFAPLFEPVVAKLQADVGEFLGDRQVLLTLQTRAATSGEVTDVTRLLGQQAVLEAELPGVMQDYEALRQQGASVYGTSRMIGFVARMEAHIGQVRALQRQFGSRGVVRPDTSPVSPGTALWVGAGFIGLTLLYRLSRRSPTRPRAR